MLTDYNTKTTRFIDKFYSFLLPVDWNLILNWDDTENIVYDFNTKS
jgi:hypothetical protein